MKTPHFLERSGCNISVEYGNSIIYLIISSLINICLIFILLSQKNSKNTILPYYYDNNNNEHNKNNNINYNNIKINKEKNYSNPFLPFNKEEIIVKEYHKTKYDSSPLRFHFEDIYLNRTLFYINYSYIPYTQIKKSLSYDENAKIIFESTGMLNTTLLDIYYFNNVSNRN